MGKIKLLLLLAASFIFGSNVFAQKQGADSILLHAQDKIYEAFIASFTNRNVGELQKIQQSIQALDSKSQIANYWIPYSKYYESIYYLKTRDNDQAKKSIDEGIDFLTKIDDKNAEMYALLAHLQSFSIQFEKGMGAMGVSKQVLENVQKALELEPNNPRAWYVMGCNDYYKPKQYGGKKKCEEYLLKAIHAPEHPQANPYLPTWGISDAYALLIQYYVDNNDMEKAKETYEKGSSLFPDDYMINQYGGQFK